MYETKNMMMELVRIGAILSGVFAVSFLNGRLYGKRSRFPFLYVGPSYLCLVYLLQSSGYVYLSLGTLIFILGFVSGDVTLAVGLTGGIATGKSTVSALWRKKGVPIIDADVIAREVVLPGRWAYRRIVEAFGEEVLSEDKSIDRAKLGQLIFESVEKRKQLNRCTHPAIILEMFRQLVSYRLFQQRRVVVFDAPLLFESGVLASFCYPIVVVACCESTQLDRLEGRNGFSKDEAQKRIDAQMSLTMKMEKADIVLDNMGTLEDLESRAISVLKQLCRGLQAESEIDFN